MNAKAYSIQLYGNAIVIVVFVILSVVFVLLDIKELCVLSALLAAIRLFLMLTSPRCYVFSEDRVVIKYFFGLEENVLWRNLKFVENERERFILRYYYINQYHLMYNTDQKLTFFMQGKVDKNKKTEQLMKEYCPCNFD